MDAQHEESTQRQMAGLNDADRMTESRRRRLAAEDVKLQAKRERSNQRPTKMMLLWAVLGAVALTLFVGFNWGGWTTAGKAATMAETATTTAVINRLADICVAQAGSDPASTAKLAELVTVAGTRQRTTFVETAGWATMPGETTPATGVAAACVRLLLATTSS